MIEERNKNRKNCIARRTRDKRAEFEEARKKADKVCRKPPYRKNGRKL